MNKLIAAPVIAVLAAGAAASAAGFAGGVTSQPIQSGDSAGVECADAANVEWSGFENDTATVTGARITLVNAQCDQDTLWLAALDSSGKNIGQGSATTPAMTSKQDVTVDVRFKSPVAVAKIEKARVTVEGR